MPTHFTSEQTPLLVSPNGQGGAIGTGRNEPNEGKDTPNEYKPYVMNPPEDLGKIHGSMSSNNCVDSTTVLTLAFVTFVQAYLLEGVFPYAGFLTINLLSYKNEGRISDGDAGTVVINEETVGRYAGFVACSFMVGRTVTAVLWGKLADTYGRVFVLKFSLVASAITSVGFGFARTYWEALLWRFLMGVGNGITGTIKCLLSEIRASSGSQAKETKTMAIVYGMRGYGFLICPGITGYLSDPMKQYPQTMTSLMSPLWIQSLLRAFPFVLPNLLACGLCLIACFFVQNHVDETLPAEICQPLPSFTKAIQICSRLLPFNRTTDSEGSSNDKHRQTLERDSHKIEIHNGDDNTGDGNGTENKMQDLTPRPSVTLRALLWSDFYTPNSEGSMSDKSGSERSLGCAQEKQEKQRKVRNRWFHLYVYWMYSFLNIATDEMFPLFCLSKLSGLGLKENQISFLLGGSTVVYGLLQYLLLTELVRKLGLYPTLRVGTFCSVPLGIFIPLGTLWLTKNSNEDGGGYAEDETTEQFGKLRVFPVLYICLVIAIMKSFSSVVFSAVNMAINRTVDTIDQRGSLNGIASLGGSFAKACGPLFAGFLFSFLASNDNNFYGATTTREEPSAVNGFGDGDGKSNGNNGGIGSILFDHRIIDPPYGSIVAYGIVSILGLILGLQTLALHHHPVPS